MPPRQNSQVRRWCFTLNNYDEACNFTEIFSSPEFQISRVVWGRELAPETRTRHLQGYLELIRSYRFPHLKKILPNAHWECARGSARDNFKYCTKEGDYDCIGDWSREMADGGSAVEASVGLIVSGLLSEHAPIVRVSKEYAGKFMYYEKTARYVQKLRMMRSLYNEWIDEKLYDWQHRIFIELMGQDKRTILWVCDAVGNNGKTWFSQYLCILYGFQVFDGILKARDICQLLDDSPKGFCFDVCRTNICAFDYYVLESLKNGVIMTGKYSGGCWRFPSCPVLVLANALPDRSKLSADRWNILTLGEGDFGNVSKDPIYCPKQNYPSVAPQVIPILDDNFDLRKFLTAKLGLGTATNTTVNLAGTSAVGTSEAQDCPNTVSPVNLPRTTTAAKSVQAKSARDSPRSAERVARAGNMDDSDDDFVDRPVIAPQHTLPVTCRIHPRSNKKFKKGCPCLWKKNRK